MRKPIFTFGAGLAVALTVGLATPAMATAAPHVTGSFSLGNPAQYETINNVSAPAGGSISYTNFTYPDPGSGVWSLQTGTDIQLNFSLGAVPYDHTMVVDSIEATSLSSISFTAHGSWNFDASYTWKSTGTVSGNALSMHLVYTGNGAPYSANVSGTIGKDGTLSGSTTDSLGQTLALSAPAGSAFEALAYTAKVNNVKIDGNTATIPSVVPSGHALAGTAFTQTVTDNGSPAPGHDTFNQDGYNYAILSGNLVVH